MEKWKTISSHKGYYQISSLGRVKSVEKTISIIVDNISHNRNYKEKILCPILKKEGYYVITLSYKNIQKQKFIHRLVATAFVPNLFNKPQVNHKDLVKTNNDFKNLEWVYPVENIHHAMKNNAFTNGEKNGQAKLNEFQIRVIRKTNDYSYKELAKIFRINHWHVRAIKKYRRWQHI